MQKFLVWPIFLILLWVGLMGSAAPLTIIAAIIIALIIVFFAARLHNTGFTVSLRPLKIFSFIIFMIIEIIKANIMVAHEILTKEEHSCPGIIRFPLSCDKDYQQAWLASMISLTPGTLTLAISEDNSALFVHVMFLQNPEQVKQGLKDLEKHIIELMP